MVSCSGVAQQRGERSEGHRPYAPPRESIACSEVIWPHDRALFARTSPQPGECPALRARRASVALNTIRIGGTVLPQSPDRLVQRAACCALRCSRTLLRVSRLFIDERVMLHRRKRIVVVMQELLPL